MHIRGNTWSLARRDISGQDHPELLAAKPFAGFYGISGDSSVGAPWVWPHTAGTFPIDPGLQE